LIALGEKETAPGGEGEDAANARTRIAELIPRCGVVNVVEHPHVVGDDATALPLFVHVRTEFDQ
jgi:hypothetical protein